MVNSLIPACNRTDPISSDSTSNTVEAVRAETSEAVITTEVVKTTRIELTREAETTVRT